MPAATKQSTTVAAGNAPRWIDYVPLAEVAGAVRNPKTHDRRGIRASVEAFGFVEPIVRDERTGRLVAGHGRIEQLRALEATEARRKRNQNVPDGVRVGGDGRWLVPVVRGWSSADDAAAEAYLVASNRLTERGGWDDVGLAAVLTAVQDADPGLLALTGFDDAALAGLLESVAAHAAAPAGDPDALPVIAPDPISRPGDVWTLGPHRLVVGDASVPATLAALMADGERATCLLTDPPYGVDYTGKTAAALRIAGDDEGAAQLLADVLEASRPHLTPGAAFYVFFASGPPGVPMLALLAAPPWRLRQTLLWCKSTFALGYTDYHYAHEPVAAGDVDDESTSQNPPADEGQGGGVVGEQFAYGHAAGGSARGRGRRGGGWYGSNAEASVLHFPTPAANVDHPTPKPPALLARLIGNSTRRDHLVLDPFAGSGSTLAACHLTGRVARMVELDPRYADGICRRWQHLSGSPPIRDGAAVPFPPTALVTEETT
jgi:hypothetical protein